MTTNYGQQVYSRGSGTASTSLLDAVREPRDPTTADTQYPLGKHWINTSTNKVFYYVTQNTSPSGIQAVWTLLSNGSFIGAIDTINTIPPDGIGNFTIQSTSGSIVVSNIVNGISLDLIGGGATYQGNAGGLVVPDGANTLFIVGNNSSGINVVGNAPINTLTIAGIQSTTAQQGTITLATNAQAIAGADANNAITAASLAAKLGTQTLHALPIGAGAAAALTWTAPPTNGQLLVGSTGLDPVLANLTPGTGISITNGAGSISISTSGTTTLNYTPVSTTPYVVLGTDEFLGVDSSGGAIIVQLPNAPATGRVFIIKDSKGSAVAFNITVTTVGGVVNIDGAATYVMKTNFQSINVLFNGSNYEVF